MNQLIAPVIYCLLVYIILNTNYVICENSINYYTNLILNEVNKASVYVGPDNAYSYMPTSSSVTEYGTYDYIIIGAGSAGSVIASRLTEIKSNKVLLLEAGGEESDFSDIPGMVPYVQLSDYNWNYTTTRQENNCLGTINEACPYPRGKGLGGTSLINACTYARGNRIDYDIWRAQGNPGWSYEDILPYFKKSENSHIQGDRKYHGYNGYLDINYADPLTPQASAFIDANIEMHRPFLDYNGENQLGVSRMQVTTKNGRRVSVAAGILQPAKNRPNLDIQTYAYVMKINIDTVTKKATSVLFVVEGKLYYAKVNKEIILSAGTVGSPQLLMLSGIGPKEHLNQLNIPVIQPLAVGNNLRDQATYVSLNFQTNYTVPTITLEENVKEYLSGVGPLTKSGNSEALVFVETSINRVPGRPDIELIIRTSNNTGPIVKRVFDLDDDTYNSIWSPSVMDPSKSFSINIVLLHPKSQGYVRLVSNNPFDYPEINPRYFTDSNKEDIETVYRGIQLSLELQKTKAFQKINTNLLKLTHPRCEGYKYLSRDYWYCQIKQLGFHIYHPVGTCKMGPNPYTGAVVDHKLKVHGIKGLRVADVSILPVTISGHTNAAAIMIGEKAAQMIKDDDNSF